MDIGVISAEAERDENTRNGFPAGTFVPTFYTENSDHTVIDTQPPLSNNDNLTIDNDGNDGLMACCLCGGCYDNNCGCFDCEDGTGDCCDCGGDGGDCCGGGGGDVDCNCGDCNIC